MLWREYVEEIIAANRFLDASRREMEASCDSLATASGLLLNNQLQMASSEAAAWHPTRVEQASRMQSDITRFRQNTGRLMESIDDADVEATLAHLDAAIATAEQYLAQSTDGDDRQRAQTVIELARRTRGLAAGLGEQCLDREAAIADALVLSDATNRSILISLDTLDGAMSAQIEHTEQTVRFALATVLLLAGVSMVTAILLTVMIVRGIKGPIREIVTAADTISVGDTRIAIDYNGADELGELAHAFRRMIEATDTQIAYANQMAQGDLSLNIETRSENDMMCAAIRDMVLQLRGIFREIRISSSQVRKHSSPGCGPCAASDWTWC